MTDPARAGGHRAHDREHLHSGLFVFGTVAALFPLLVAVWREVTHGWVPAGDAGVFAVRSRDVFSAHPPLVGTWSSRSLTAGTDLHHPGPLLFDLLAVPERVVDSRAALTIGVALVNALALVGIALVARRRGGPLVGTAAVVVAVALAWSMGSGVLVDPWNPHTMLLPFLCFLMLVWSISSGDIWALPWAAGVGSLVLQTHLSYALLVPALGAWAVLGLGLELRRRRRDDPLGWPGLRRRVVRAGAAAGGILAVCWVQPVIEQFSAGGGNLTALARSTFDSESSPIGWELGARLVAAVVALPPFWVRSSFSQFDPGTIGGWRPTSLGPAVASLAVVALVLTWCGRDAHRRRDRTAVRLVITAGLVLVAGLVTTGTASPGGLGTSIHLFRWLWPTAAFVWFAVIVTLLRRVGDRPARSLALVVALTLATVVLVGLNLPASDQGVSTPPWAIPVARDLTGHMAVLEGEGPLFVDWQPFIDVYGSAVIAELNRRDIPFVVPSGMASQYGKIRRFDGTNASAVLYVRSGPAIVDVPVEARRVALVHGLDQRERRELRRLEAEIDGYLRMEGRLRLNERGRNLMEIGGLPNLERQRSNQSLDPEPLFASREIVRMVDHDLLVLDDRWVGRFERYAELQARWDRATVALFVGPL